MAYWEPEADYQLGKGDYALMMAGDVLTRMREAAGLGSLPTLAERPGVNPALLADAGRRNIVPVRRLQAMPHASWILKGKGKGPC